MPQITGEIVAIAQAAQCNVFIESGTFYGQTFGRVAASGLFERCYSVEIQPHLYDMLQQRFLTTPHQQIFFGSSHEQFEQSIFPRCTQDDRLFFWLDGHFSAGETGGAEFPCPLLDELQAIAQHCPTDNIVIAIDDADDLGRIDPAVAGNNWPSRDEIETAAYAINPDLHLIDYTGTDTTLPKINRGVLLFSSTPFDAASLTPLPLSEGDDTKRQLSFWQRVRRWLPL